MSEFILRADGLFRWYVPGDSNDGGELVAGTLQIEANGTSKLSLVGLLSDSASSKISLATPPIDENRCIVGVLKDRGYVFLRRIGGGGTTFSNVLSHQTYQAREAVVFHDLEKNPDLDAVTKLVVGLDDLGDWASEPAVTVKTTSRGATARASKSGMQTFKLSDKTVRLKTTIKYSVPAGHCQRSVTIKQETFWEVQPKTPYTLDAVREEFRLLEDFLFLLADLDVVLPWPTVKYGRQTGIYYFEQRQPNSQRVDILKSWATLRRLATNVGTLLSNLKAQRDVLGPGLYLYLGIRRSPALYLENRFSTAIFGIEALHRKVGTSVDRSKFEEKIARIIADVQKPKDKDWLRERIMHAAEPSLQERIFSTFSELEIGLDAEELREFAQKCARLRNDIAHFGGQREGDYHDFVRRIHVLNAAVQPLYHAVLLQRIGLNEDRIWAYFHKSPYSSQRKECLKTAGLTLMPRAPLPQKVGMEATPEQTP